MTDKNTSTVIVALPSSDDAINEFGPEQKHATLLFLGEIDDAFYAIAAARELASTLGPLEVTVTHKGELGEDDPPARVLFLDRSSPLASVRDRLLEAEPVRELWSAIKQYPSFTPHMTLGYGDEVSDDDWDDVLANVPVVTFDRLAVWHRDEQVEYPLGFRRFDSMVAGVKFVRTPEGARRYGVPINTQIRTDDDGKVAVVDEPETKSTTVSSRTTLPPVDPNRKPSKFVATVPGQKAKLVVEEPIVSDSKGRRARAARALRRKMNRVRKRSSEASGSASSASRSERDGYLDRGQMSTLEDA